MSDPKALEILVNSPITQQMIQKLVVTTLQVLPCQSDSDHTKTSYPSPPTTPTKHSPSSPVKKPLPSLMTFITKLVRYTNVYTGTLMATLVYLNRLKMKLPKNAQGLPCTRHRIFLSCLILSAKYHNDSSPKNVNWAEYTDGLFDTKDINLMERQLCFLLDWDLRVSNEEMIEELKPEILTPILIDLKKSSRLKKQLLYEKQQKLKQKQKLQKEQHQLQHSQSLQQLNCYRSSSPSSYVSQSPSYSYNNTTLAPVSLPLKSSSRSSSTSPINPMAAYSTLLESPSSSNNSSRYPSPDLQSKLSNYKTLTLPILPHSYSSKKLNQILNGTTSHNSSRYHTQHYVTTIDT